MYCGTDRHGWDKFWAKRGNSPTPVSDLTPFYNNFGAMMLVAERCNIFKIDEFLHSGRYLKLKRRSTLEVGAGRGTISELFNKKGFKTFCTDIENRIAYPRYDFPFVKNDILESRPFIPEQFDITFSYGLLEHFDSVDRYTAVRRCLEMTRPGGLSMHYVVPEKWTNIFEDRSVYRDKCKDTDSIIKKAHNSLGVQSSGVNYVYPYRPGPWETSSFKSKGFILWFKKYTAMDIVMKKHIDAMFAPVVSKILKGITK